MAEQAFASVWGLPRIDMAAIQAKLSEGLSPAKSARDMEISRGTVYKTKALMPSGSEAIRQTAT